MDIFEIPFGGHFLPWWGLPSYQVSARSMHSFFHFSTRGVLLAPQKVEIATIHFKFGGQLEDPILRIKSPRLQAQESLFDPHMVFFFFFFPLILLVGLLGHNSLNTPKSGKWHDSLQIYAIFQPIYGHSFILQIGFWP